MTFGLPAGGPLDLHTTLCIESRASIVVDDFDNDPVYCAHRTARIYKPGSYISVPIILPDGGDFGNLCAIDPAPTEPSNPRMSGKFEVFAELIAN
ncbi:GAF domain-containing protein [Paraburkholderia fynbosensis]|uniref:GAF domain-containing protein n=1 Tax=Paraburkholderia fynbosensis TaxID=1200993 RepID=A0A6J5FET9_9BURK|nr:GAF domain-containing protein [Paraburkholderia fynbosensis]CAB3776231.1 hypothetical protein LMG27177_00099 [Paraburkholderia fynbosensis]